MKKNIKYRLFAKQTIDVADLWIPDAGQAHYLLNVLRLTKGDEIKLFDGKNGEFIGQICDVSKKSCSVKILQKTREMQICPDIWLLFAPVKKDKTDFIIAGATELGVAKIWPTITRFTLSEKVKKERYEAQVIEAAEQCRRLDIPQIEEPQSLEKILQNWPHERILYFMDETGNGADIQTVFQSQTKSSAAILVGPEGGFAEDELHLLRQKAFAKGVSMGKRILRAETAVISALSCWQAICGDWK